MGGGAGRAQVILCYQEKGNKAHKNSLVGADEEEPELLERERTAHTLCIGSVWWCSRTITRETFQQLVQQLVSMAWNHIHLRCSHRSYLTVILNASQGPMTSLSSWVICTAIPGHFIKRVRACWSYSWVEKHIMFSIHHMCFRED
jgi:hypothetical protein